MALLPQFRCRAPCYARCRPRESGRPPLRHARACPGHPDWDARCPLNGMAGTSPAMTYQLWAREIGNALRIELGVPVEIIEPAVVQVVRRKTPAVAMQMIDGRLERHLRRIHLRLVRRQVALLQIARRAGGHHV